MIENWQAMLPSKRGSMANSIPFILWQMLAGKRTAHGFLENGTWVLGGSILSSDSSSTSNCIHGSVLFRWHGTAMGAPVSVVEDVEEDIVLYTFCQGRRDDSRWQ